MYVFAGSQGATLVAWILHSGTLSLDIDSSTFPACEGETRKMSKMAEEAARILKGKEKYLKSETADLKSDT